MEHPEIFLVRHGETTWNRIGRHQGHMESELTLNGIEQVRGVARRLASEITGWDAVALASSPQFRCRQTAAVLCDEVGANFERVVLDDRLKERSYGHWEGLTDAEIKARFPDEWQAREADRWTYTIPGGGENYPATTTRVAAWLAEQPTDRPIILITHGQAGRALRGHLLGLGPAETLALSVAQTAAIHLKDGESRPLDGIY